jgi:hypothetical protein
MRYLALAEIHNTRRPPEPRRRPRDSGGDARIRPILRPSTDFRGSVALLCAEISLTVCVAQCPPNPATTTSHHSAVTIGLGH